MNKYRKSTQLFYDQDTKVFLFTLLIGALYFLFLALWLELNKFSFRFIRNEEFERDLPWPLNRLGIKLPVNLK